jgi:proteasome lid subunit RPN8/RPN11
MKLLITPQAHERIRAFTMLAKGEISGLGKIEIDGDDNFIVTEVEIFDQEVSGAHSTIETAALAKFQTERVQAGESMKQWTLWWHSHADMSVFFSTTDTNTIDSSREFPYLVSLVVNKKGDSKARLDIFHPVHVFKELEVEVFNHISQEIKDLCQKEIDVKLKEPKTTRYTETRGTGFKSVGKDGYWEKDQHGISRFHRFPTHNPYEEEEAGMGYRTDAEDGYESLDEAVARYLREGPDGLDRDEYFDHKRYIMKQIKKAAKKPSQEAKLLRMRQELHDHMIYGKAVGYEPLETKLPTLPSITSDKQTSLIPPNIPPRGSSSQE